MKVSVQAPKTPVTRGSNGVAAATVPNVCKMPGPPAPFVPTPLPNIGKSGDSPKGYTKNVTVEGKQVAVQGASFGSTGDMASKGTGGGLVSANTHGPTKFVGPGAMDVKFEGKNVQLLADPMLNNCGASGSPPNAATLMGVMQDVLIVVDGRTPCPVCEGNHGPLKETKQTKESVGSLAEKVDAVVKVGKVNRKGKREEFWFVTMLGVVRCRCNALLADHSGVTRHEFLGAARDAGCVPPPTSYLGMEVAQSDERFTKADTDASRRFKQRLIGAVGPAPVLEAWGWAEHLSKESALSLKTDHPEPAAYPPGCCAAQKCMLVTIEEGGHPVGLSEELFHCKGKKMGATVRYLDATDPIAGPEPVVRSFEHGETVPPCRTCEIMLPLMLCTDKEKTPCNHRR